MLKKLAASATVTGTFIVAVLKYVEFDYELEKTEFKNKSETSSSSATKLRICSKKKVGLKWYIST